MSAPEDAPFSIPSGNESADKILAELGYSSEKIADLVDKKILG